MQQHRDEKKVSAIRSQKKFKLAKGRRSCALSLRSRKSSHSLTLKDLLTGKEIRLQVQRACSHCFFFKVAITGPDPHRSLFRATPPIRCDGARVYQSTSVTREANTTSGKCKLCRRHICLRPGGQVNGTSSGDTRPAGYSNSEPNTSSASHTGRPSSLPPTPRGPYSVV